MTKFDDFIKSKKKANIVIIGGGPVGMMTAIALLEYKNPRINSITILEKREQFTRDQIIVIGSRFFAHDKNFLKQQDLRKKIYITSKLKNELTKKLKSKGGCYVKQPFLSLDATCYRNESTLISSPLKIIEESILEMLESRIKKENKIKIEIIKPVFDIKINDKNNIIEYINKKDKYCYLNYDILIGTDGKNSIVKNKFKKYFEEDIIIPKNENIFAGVFIFKIKPKDIITSNESGFIKFPILQDIENTEFNTGEINTKKRKKYKIFPQQRVRIFQHQEGYVYIGFSLNESEYKQIENAKIIPDKIFTKIQSYLSINKINIDRKTPVKFSIFPIIVSQVIKPYYFSNNAAYFLGGDAVISTHFFTGSGLDTGLALSIEGTAQKIDFILNESKNSKEISNIFKQEFLDFNQEFSIQLDTLYAPPRVSLDFSEITKKCNKMSEKKLKELGKDYALDSLTTKEGISLLDMLDKTELCYLIIDESIKNKFGKKHFNLKSVLPGFNSSFNEEYEQILKEWENK